MADLKSCPRKPRLPPSDRRADVHGHTLIEMTIVLAIAGIFVAFVANALLSAATAYNQVSVNFTSQAQLRYAMDRIANELREVGTVPGTPRTFNFTTPVTPTNPSNKIVFVKNDATTVTIDGSSGTVVNMTHSSPAATGRLADIAATNALQFRFYDHNTNGITPSTAYATDGPGAADVGAVEFTLTVTVNGVANTATTRVALRGTL